MLIDELQEQLKKLEPDIGTIKVFWNNAHFEEKFKELFTKTQESDFWKNPDQVEILKEFQALKNQRETYQTIVNFLNFANLMQIHQGKKILWYQRRCINGGIY